MKSNHKVNTTQYQEYGSGDEVIILIHGFLSSSNYWNKIIPSLTKAGYRVISINLMGFGNAKRPTDINYDYGDQVKYVKTIIDDLKFSKPMNIVGHSMGAAIATRYAKLYKQNIRSLILIHPPLYKNAREAQNTLMNTSGFYRFLLASKYRNIGWHLLKFLLPHIVSPHTQLSRELSLKNIILKAEVITDLEDISTKTLLLIGLKDRAIYQNNLSTIIYNTNIKVIKENVDHHSPIKYPRLIKNYILTFVKISS